MVWDVFHSCPREKVSLLYQWCSCSFKEDAQNRDHDNLYHNYWYTSLALLFEMVVHSVVSKRINFWTADLSQNFLIWIFIRRNVIKLPNFKYLNWRHLSSQNIGCDRNCPWRNDVKKGTFTVDYMTMQCIAFHQRELRKLTGISIRAILCVKRFSPSVTTHGYLKSSRACSSLIAWVQDTPTPSASFPNSPRTHVFRFTNDASLSSRLVDIRHAAESRSKQIKLLGEIMISEKLYIWNELFLATLRISSKSCILHFNTNSLIIRKKLHTCPGHSRVLNSLWTSMAKNKPSTEDPPSHVCLPQLKLKEIIR